MAEKYPHDRFDELPVHPERVGVHRAAPRKFRRLTFVLSAFAAIGLLTGLGVGAVVVIDNGIFSAIDDTAATPTPTVEPTVDASVPVTVLNGTPTSGLDVSAGDELTAAGFTVASTANADKSDVTESAVYYGSADLEAVARGVAQTLGISKVVASTMFSSIGSSLTVVVGTDFVPSPVG
ncbi:MAG: LytR C-terminal domain-containing protein [Agromyces sp.]